MKLSAYFPNFEYLQNHPIKYNQTNEVFEKLSQILGNFFYGILLGMSNWLHKG